MTDKEKATREYLQTLTKDRVIKLCLQYIFDKSVVETQLEEKDKVIVELKALLNAKEKLKTLLIQRSNKLKQNQIQLAIQELEKVKVELKAKIKIMNNEEHCYPQKFVKWIDVCDQLNQQIKELSGGKNGKF